ncbi:insulinase family protein [Pelagibacterales bacterium SAG-MED16]|nr:insulinase family protein [Pelagibacterales bacterium SAG-MED16]
MKKLSFIFVIFLLLVGKSFANEFPLDPSITYGKLENGLTYYIKKNNYPSSKVKIKLVVKAGSLMEEDHQRGLSHLIEHMAFNGSKNFPGNNMDIFLSSIGLNLGSHYNASAGYYNTNYRFELPTDNFENIETGLMILSDIAGNLSLEDEQFEKERKIVEEEWRGDLGSDNRYVEEVSKYIKKDSRLLQRKPIGDIEVIRNFEYQDAKDFYNKWYRPDLMGLFIIGDIEPDKIEKLVQKHFSYLVNNSIISLPNAKIPDFEENQFFSYQAKNEDDVIFTIWEKNDFKALNTFENYKISKIKTIIRSIFQKRIEKFVNDNSVNFKSSNIANFNVSNLDEYYLIITSLKSDKILEGIADIYSIIDQIQEHGFLELEFNQTKKQILENLEQNLIEAPTRSSSSYINEYTRHFTEDEMISGPINELAFTKKIFEEIKLDDLNKYFLNYTKAKNQIIEIRGPNSISNFPKQNEIINIKQETFAKASKPYKFDIIKTKLITQDLKGSEIIKSKFYPVTNVKMIQLKNGAKIYLKKTDFKKDEIFLDAYSLGGYSTAPLETLPSAKYTDSILVMADFGDLTIPQKENLYPPNILDIYPEIHQLTENIFGYTNNFYLEDLFKLLYLTFTDLRIQQNHVDRFKEEKIDAIKIDEKIPKTKFYKDLMNKFYQNHIRTTFPSVDYIQQINLKDVQEFYKDRFQNSGDFIFTIVGDFEYKQIEPLISKYIGSLEFKNKKDKFIDHNIRTNLKSEKITYKEDNPVKASYGRFYNKKFNNTLTERYKAELLSLIIDKLFFDEIREENKLVYSIFISEYFNQKFPIELYSFYLGYEADPKNIELINSKIEQILNKIKKGEFDKKIFNEQKKSLLNDYEEQIKSNYFWINSIVNANKYNESIERIFYLDKVINQITFTEIKKLAKKYFDDTYFETLQLLEE